MGTLIGHVGPGFGFFMIGLWHLYNNLKLLALKGRHYRSLPWFPTSFIRHLELYLIIAATATSVSMELFIGPRAHQPLDTDGTIPSNHLQNFEHSSISLTFLVYAAFALTLDLGLARPNPAHHDVVQFVGAVAFAQQLLLFHLHSADHMGVEGQYHWLLQLVVFVSLATTLLGIGHVSNFVIAFVRSLSILLQGAWLMVMGYALWTPNLIPKGCFMHVEEGHKVVRCDGEMSLHRAKALVNIEFSWLLILLGIFAASFYMVMMRIYGGDKVEYDPMLLTDEDEEEVEDHLDVEAQKMGWKFTETQSFANFSGNNNNNNNNNNNKGIDHMER